MSNATAETPDQQRERMHRDMLSKVAHDLKSPLASVIGSLQVYTAMQKTLPIEKQRELVEVALQEACRLDLFINNVLDMAKLDNDMVRVKTGRVDLGGLLQQAVAAVEPQLRGGKVSVKDSAAPTLVTTDPALLSRVVALVLDNAIKYGSVPPVVEVAYDDTFVTIRDHGAGLPDAQRDNVFTKYTRLDRGEGQSQPGLGIGLSIARGMMQVMQSDITIANHPEGGAIVTLRLPV